MAHDPNQSGTPGRTPDVERRDSGGYRPERPANVVDTPPENLPAPSAESPLADTPATPDGGSGNANASE